MERTQPYNALHARYASDEMAAVFSQEHRYRLWRQLWVHLATAQRELGLPISQEQLAALAAAETTIDFDRVAELEAETRHDVVAHLRHFSELAGDAGSILHLGATSAFITDNTDVVLLREGMSLLERRLGSAIHALAGFARRHRDLPALAYTHFQPAQLTTVGKRACLWAQDLVEDLEALRARLATLRCRGAKGTTGTQASYLTLFAGDHAKVRELDRRIADRLGFAASYPITGQTYPRKQDSQVLGVLAGIAESCHKLGTDLRLLQGVGELAEPFGASQVGSSAMAYKRNPIRAERMCSLARRLLTDSLNGPLTASVQWLERSLDDSANRRLVLTDAFLVADAVLGLAAGIAAGLTVRQEAIASRVAKELPFMATETLLMTGTVRGGDRQALHERIRQYSLEAHAAVARGEANPLVERILADSAFSLDRAEVEAIMNPGSFVGRSAEQVDDFLAEVVAPALAGLELAAIEEPRV
jgi:adenylosuccinate lyase